MSSFWLRVMSPRRHFGLQTSNMATILSNGEFHCRNMTSYCNYHVGIFTGMGDGCSAKWAHYKKNGFQGHDYSILWNSASRGNGSNKTMCVSVLGNPMSKSVFYLDFKNIIMIKAFLWMFADEQIFGTLSLFSLQKILNYISNYFFLISDIILEKRNFIQPNMLKLNNVSN